MAQISAIYKKHRGTKEKRKKKGFPPAVAARLKRLMAQRDKDMKVLKKGGMAGLDAAAKRSISQRTRSIHVFWQPTKGVSTRMGYG